MIYGKLWTAATPALNAVFSKNIVKVYIKFLAGHESHIPHTVCQGAPGLLRELTGTQQNVLNFQRNSAILNICQAEANYFLKDIHGLNIKLCYIPFNNVMSLRS